MRDPYAWAGCIVVGAVALFVAFVLIVIGFVIRAALS